MLIQRIELENIKSYHQVTVELRPGTTAISGSNGAGKTTLVEAIGFALFGYLPYSQEQFVREGEKNGKVVIHLIGSDDRPYVVERRCGSGARWLIYDTEADMRLEQRADVLDKLHDLFGIDRERALDTLFRDALGVPQGTFTSIFLEAASKRKQTFDALLQIEDYKTAADYLLETQKVYKGQMHEQDIAINGLSISTKNLPQWLDTLKEFRVQEQQQAAQLAQQAQRLTQYQTRLDALRQQEEYIRDVSNKHASAQSNLGYAQRVLTERQNALDRARTAHRIVSETEQLYQQYEQAQLALNTLRKDAYTRDNLRQQEFETKQKRMQVSGNISKWEDRLTDIQSAYQKIVELAPEVEKQAKLEERLNDAIQRASRYDGICEEGTRIRRQYDRFQQEVENYKQKIESTENLLPLAQLLDERLNNLNQLKLRASERAHKQKQLQDARVGVQKKQQEREQITTRLRQYEQRIAFIEEHRSEAESFPQLQTHYEELSTRLHRLEGNIEGYVKSRAQSAGGQCPLLQESCLNIRKHGIASLESYFDNLLNSEHTQAQELRQEQSTISKQLKKAKPYADELGKLSQYTEQKETYTSLIQNLTREITEIENNIVALTSELDSLKTIERQVSQAQQMYNESKEADSKVRDRENWQKQVQTMQEQLQNLDADLKKLRQEAAKYKGSQAETEQLRNEIADLHDPRGQSRAQQNIIANEKNYTQSLQKEQLLLQEVEYQLQSLAEQLGIYSKLDQNIAREEAQVQHSREGHQRYLGNQGEAQSLPEREQAYQKAQQTAEVATKEVQQLQQELSDAQASFDASELVKLDNDIKQLRDAQSTLSTTMQRHQKDIKNLEQQITQAETLLIELEAAQKEHQTLSELAAMTEQFRKLIKEAAPHVLRAMLADISSEANRIFGETMGDRSAQLSWRNDYEIVLRRQGVDRTFAQLSGGEQMSAALAVRLALLKKLSTLNIAFFDEPTQNMDELRRMNLAEQIRRVRGFDQLIVISHDDTFEQGLDSLIRLKKVNGDTRVMEDDGVASYAPMEQTWQGSGPSILQPTN